MKNYSINIPSEWVEIYSTEAGSVYQSNAQNCLWLLFRNRLHSFSIPCFKNFRKKVNEIDLDQMALNIHPSYDYISLSLDEQSLFFALNLVEAFCLKELLDGAKLMLELNSILHERLYSFCFS